MIENEKKLKEILIVLKNENILENIIIIGSWSLFFYEEVFENFRPLIRTTDLDCYVPDVKVFSKKYNIINSFKLIDYDVFYDVITKISKIESFDGFKLEFLTKLYREQMKAIKMGNTGLYAESLSYIDLFANNYIEVQWNEMTIKVISPASYVLQKLLINHARNEEKRLKDVLSINYVLHYISQSEKYEADLKRMFAGLPSQWKKKILLVAAENNIKLFK